MNKWPTAPPSALSPRQLPRETRIFKKPATGPTRTGVRPGSRRASPSPKDRRNRSAARSDRYTSNPLTPRVIVHRICRHFSGAGFVTTPEDFGHARSRLPTRTLMAGEVQRRGLS